MTNTMKSDFPFRRILITTASVVDKGGVASFVTSILTPLSSSNLHISLLEIGSTSGKGGFLHPLLDQIEFRKRIRSGYFDIVHINPSLDLKSFFRDGLFVWMARKQNIPILVFFHGWIRSFESKIEKRWRRFFIHTYRKANGFVVLASHNRKILEHWGITVPIFMGTTVVADDLLKKFSISNKILKLKDDEEFKILFLSRVERDKGILEAIHAVKMLKERGCRCSLSVAGEGSALKNAITLAKSLKLESPYVKFLGYLRGKEKKEAFIENHVFCLPSSHGEGIPTAMVEAMSFGMPLVVTNVGGIRDIWADKKMGILLNKPDKEDIAVAIDSLLSDKDRMIKTAEFNFSYAKRHFLASVVSKKLRGIYETILESNKTE